MTTRVNYHEYMASREWALKKNAIRQRSGGMCERGREVGHVAVQQSTHHLTYERLGHERLEDLLGVCDDCHRWLSGLTDVDPAVPRVARDWWIGRAPPLCVYLAGKIAKNDWRHTLFPTLRDTWNSSDLEMERAQRKAHDGLYLVWARGNTYPERDGLVYGGPYFVSCDHGCFHGNGSHGQAGHGCGQDGLSRIEVLEACLQLIDKANVVFCWLSETSRGAYGTLVELGYAAAHRKPIFLAMSGSDQWSSDLWFAREIADGTAQTPDHTSGWTLFLESLRRHELL